MIEEGLTLLFLFSIQIALKKEGLISPSLNA